MFHGDSKRIQSLGLTFNQSKDQINMFVSVEIFLCYELRLSIDAWG